MESRLQFKVVSSLYIKTSNTVVDRGKSLIYTNNKSGPRTELSGTSVVIFQRSDCVPYILHTVLYWIDTY